MKAKKFLALIIVLFIGSMASAQDILPRKAPHDDKTKDTAVVYGTTQPFFVPELGYQIASEFMWQDFEDALNGRSRRHGPSRDPHYKIVIFYCEATRTNGSLGFLPTVNYEYYQQNKKAFIRDRKYILTFLQKDYRRILNDFNFQYNTDSMITYDGQIKLYNQFCRNFLGNGAKNIQRTKSVQRGGKSRSTRQGRRK